jgi:16S rRNA (adenine1518-N6/adenine1519-N6)-dimethyltransferase
VGKNDHVVEVGPGKGILTGALLKKEAVVTAIEKDPAMVEILKEKFREEIRNKTLTIVEADIRDYLKEQNTTLKPYKVAANIPYYITGELLRLFLSAPQQPEALAFLVQKEVAERIARSKKESLLSLSVKVYGTPRYVKTVSKGNFTPPPKVDSAVLAVTGISRKNFTHVTEEHFFKVIKAGFAQKRKKLSGNLTRVFGSHAKEVLAQFSLADARAEDVHLDTWLSLSEKI